MFSSRHPARGGYSRNPSPDEEESTRSPSGCTDAPSRGQLSSPLDPAKTTCTFGTREELTSPARQNVSTNRPRRRCLSDEHGLVALGLAARAKRRRLNLFHDIRACGTDEEGPSCRHATRHDQFVIWSSLFEQRWSISGGRRGLVLTALNPEGVQAHRSSDRSVHRRSRQIQSIHRNPVN